MIGLDTGKEALMSQLMDFGAVEFTDQSSKLDEESWRNAVMQDENQEAVAGLEGKISRAELALTVLEKYDTGKSPLFHTRRALKRSKAQEILENFQI